MQRMRILGMSVLILLLMTSSCSSKPKHEPSDTKASATTKEAGPVRQSAWDGKFYPEDAGTLLTQVDRLLSQAGVVEPKGTPLALILPHAGYEYSGAVAAAGVKAIEGQEIDTVVIVGSSHHRAFQGVNVRTSGSYATPLGTIPIDTELAKAIAAGSPLIRPGEDDAEEHSIEVELPFLQRALSNFKIVPLLIGQIPAAKTQELGDAIAHAATGKKVLLIASSDLTHYPRYDDAVRSENELLRSIVTRKPAEIVQTVQRLESRHVENVATFACGLEAILAVIQAANDLGATDATLVKHANSGDVTGDKRRVVGYGSIVVWGKTRETGLSRADQEQLLFIAKKSVEKTVLGKPIPAFEVTSPALKKPLGAFVTLKMNGELRGCIGRFSPADRPLYEVVSLMAQAASSEDPRFPRVTEQELSKLHYEISVLSDLTPISDWHSVRLGKDGVQLAQGFHRGVFLPQVATETGWDLPTFLGELCSQKAGLPRDCYQDSKTELYTFTAQVFGEHEDHERKDVQTRDQQKP